MKIKYLKLTLYMLFLFPFYVLAAPPGSAVRSLEILQDGGAVFYANNVMKNRVIVTYELDPNEAGGVNHKSLTLRKRHTKEPIEELGWSMSYDDNEYLNDIGSTKVKKGVYSSEGAQVVQLYVSAQNPNIYDICVEIETFSGVKKDTCTPNGTINEYVTLEAVPATHYKLHDFDIVVESVYDVDHLKMIFSSMVPRANVNVDQIHEIKHLRESNHMDDSVFTLNTGYQNANEGPMIQRYIKGSTVDYSSVFLLKPSMEYLEYIDGNGWILRKKHMDLDEDYSIATIAEYQVKNDKMLVDKDLCKSEPVTTTPPFYHYVCHGYWDVNGQTRNFDGPSLERTMIENYNETIEIIDIYGTTSKIKVEYIYDDSHTPVRHDRWHFVDVDE
ncbi:hypothetical protein [Photobacterium minamisatsumaniensis]|uniref:hypothetical protein n=1 Tax=Photobacterium minamisatsumaniensis TaxID=2910233 RepID=UPI003D0F3820